LIDGGDVNLCALQDQAIAWQEWFFASAATTKNVN